MDVAHKNAHPVRDTVCHNTHGTQRGGQAGPATHKRTRPHQTNNPAGGRTAGDHHHLLKVTSSCASPLWRRNFEVRRSRQPLPGAVKSVTQGRTGWWQWELAYRPAAAFTAKRYSRLDTSPATHRAIKLPDARGARGTLRTGNPKCILQPATSTRSWKPVTHRADRQRRTGTKGKDQSHAGQSQLVLINRTRVHGPHPPQPHTSSPFTRQIAKGDRGGGGVRGGRSNQRAT